jgi:molecular chaperone GrpE
MNGQPERPPEHDADHEEVATQDDTVVEAADTGPAGDEAVVPDADTALAEAQAKADDNWDKYLRLAAELENVRKRAERDVEKAHKFALERIVADLLEVRDSLEMAVSAGDESSVENLKEGNETTLKLLATIMQRYGVEDIDPLGEPFDPNCHEAMTMQPSADAEPDSVLTVFQKGYALNGRLLRPARVVVAAAPAEGSEKG